MNRTTYLPGGAPANYFSLQHQTDIVKPVITHTALGDVPKSTWPATVSSNSNR